MTPADDLPPIPDWIPAHLHQNFRDYALAARAERDAEIEGLKAKLEISPELLAASRCVIMQSTIEKMDKEIAEQDAEIERLRKKLSDEWETAEKAIERAEAAEARVNELRDLRQNEMKMHTDAHRELTQERDTLRARVAELEEKLMVPK